MQLRRARQLLESDHPTHQAAGRTLHAQGKQAERLQQRDQRLLAGQNPGDSDGCCRAAYRYAKR